MTLKEALRVELKALAPTVAFIVIAQAMIMWVYNNGVLAAVGVLFILGAIKMAVTLGWTIVKITTFLAALAAAYYVLAMIF